MTRRPPVVLFGLFALIGQTFCLHAPPAIPRVVTQQEFDLDRYLGHWFEIASLPNPYQRGCMATEAEYVRGSKGRIKITNACRKNSLSAAKTRVTGKGWQPHPERPAELKVQLFWPFVGDYWVLGHAPDYSWAVVGQPSRRYLWFLSRTAKVDDEVFDTMKQLAIAQHYDLERLTKTAQLP